MGYWDKIKSINNLMLFATDWKTLEDLRVNFDLTPTESWKAFRRVIKNYEEFEHRDSNGLKAGCPVKFRTTPKALNILKLEMAQNVVNSTQI